MASGSNSAIVDAVLAGVADARHTYSAWTRNGGYFSWAPEYLITVSVAQALWEWCAPMSVWPEFRLSDALRDTNRGSADPFSRNEATRRADLLLYRGGPAPHAIVEVKRNVDGWAKIAADVERLRTTMQMPSSSFELGVVAFSSTLIGGSKAKGGGIMKDRLARMADCVGDIRLAGWRCRLVANDTQFDGHEHWAAAAVVLEKTTASRRPVLGERTCAGRAPQVISAS
ncbi:hypothetical protein [Magnetospirillum sp. 64-120]|uniref:hypothetical protein n=1 Tax=Magnetospirillum sp. 64-120 TaxID=1895778 RepID=UPI00092B27A8|nr:hypothetical protein [Magnetospirillum sp. 64-120]OJX71317.1 MAG: hypothetical protein BGO92_11845 [Magnetospirillum sp. 64-120]